MIQLRKQLVVDASVIIKCFIREEGSDRALALSDRAVDAEIGLHIPDFCLVECANVIWRLVVKQRKISSPRGATVMAQLTDLPFVRMPSRDLVGGAYRVAVDTGSSVYDGMYVALAQALGATLITADKQLYNRLSNTEYGEFVEIL